MSPTSKMDLDEMARLASTFYALALEEGWRGDAHDLMTHFRRLDWSPERAAMASVFVTMAILTSPEIASVRSNALGAIAAMMGVIQAAFDERLAAMAASPEEAPP